MVASSRSGVATASTSFMTSSNKQQSHNPSPFFAQEKSSRISLLELRATTINQETTPDNAMAGGGDGYYTSSASREEARSLIVDGEAIIFEEGQQMDANGDEGSRIVKVMKKSTKEVIGSILFQEVRRYVYVCVSRK